MAHNQFKAAHKARIIIGSPIAEVASAQIAFGLVNPITLDLVAYINSSGALIFVSSGQSVQSTLSITDTTTPSITLVAGSTNTGTITIFGKTSGKVIFTTADATAQTITIKPAAQTTGAVTLTTPDFAGVNDTFAFITAPQTLTAKILATLRTSTQALSGAGAVNVTTGTTKLTTTGASQALTLADGADGQIKSIIHDVDGGSAILTPTTKTGFTTITFTSVGESALLQFVTTRGWIILALNGAVAA